MRVAPRRRAWRAIRTCAIVVVALFVWTPSLCAQALSALEGRVLDATGAIVREAVVRVSNASVGFDTAVRMDAEGRYHVLAIPPGTSIVRHW